MKKQLLGMITILGMILSIGLTSCSDNDDQQTAIYPTTGTWEMTAMEYSGTTTSTFFGITEVIDYEGVGSDFNYTMVLEENPNTFTSGGSAVITLKSYENAILISEDVIPVSGYSSGTWSLNSSEDQLTLTDDQGSVSVVDIISNTGNTMVVDFGGLFNLTGGATSDVEVIVTYVKVQ